MLFYNIKIINYFSFQFIYRLPSEQNFNGGNKGAYTIYAADPSIFQVRKADSGKPTLPGIKPLPQITKMRWVAKFEHLNNYNTGSLCQCIDSLHKLFFIFANFTCFIILPSL